MKSFLNITSTLLVVFLFLLTGLGSAALALSKDCLGGHCNDHMNMTVAEHQPGHAPGEASIGVPDKSNGVEHDECNPFLCNVLVLMSLSSKATFVQSDAVLAWQVASLSTHEEPDNPDRPPNF